MFHFEKYGKSLILKVTNFLMDNPDSLTKKRPVKKHCQTYNYTIMNFTRYYQTIEYLCTCTYISCVQYCLVCTSVIKFNIFAVPHSKLNSLESCTKYQAKIPLYFKYIIQQKNIRLKKNFPDTYHITVHIFSMTIHIAHLPIHTEYESIVRFKRPKRPKTWEKFPSF